MGRPLVHGVGCAIALAALAAGAAEPTPSVEELYRIIQAQQRQLEAQRAQLEDLRRLVESRRAAVAQPAPEPRIPTEPAQAQAAEPAQPAATKRRREEARVSLDDGFKVESADGDFSFRIGGRLHLDAAWYDQDQAALGDGVEARRARVYVSGTLRDDWAFRAEYDFGDGNLGVKDAWLAYTGLKSYDLRVGQFQEPFGLEELTSSNHDTFIEQALLTAFVPSYRLGVGMIGGGERWSAVSGLFGEAVGDRGEDDIADDGWGLAARLTAAPLLEEERLLHLGVAAEYRVPDESGQARYHSAPETHVADVDLVDTGTIADVDDTVTLGLEAAAVWGPFSLQGEYVRAQVERGTGADLSFDGWYLFGSWMLTGESRRYSAQRGIFRGVKPASHRGAWELALRFSSLDLQDREVLGGEEDNLTLGLNWYLNPNVRFMANYTRADANPSTSAVGFQPGVRDQPDLFQVRAQVNF